MSAPVFVEDFEVVPFLTQMDLDREGLIEAVRYAHAERKLCTGNDANGFEQMTVYSRTARGLRETYGGGPWSADDTNGQAGIKHPDKRLRIVPCNFDENCASIDPMLQPRNRSPKGEVSGRKTRCNKTAWLPGLPAPTAPPEVQAPTGDEYITWILGIRSEDGQPLRAELSLPTEFDGSYFTKFGPRVILLRGDEDDETGAGRAAPPPTDIVDIPVRRK